jgi:hypothetical protein
MATETYKSYLTKLQATGPTQIYPGLTGTAIINDILVCNTSLTNDIGCSLFITRGLTSYYLCNDYAVTKRYNIQPLSKPLVLNSGDTVSASCLTAGFFDISLSVLEVT